MECHMITSCRLAVRYSVASGTSTFVGSGTTAKKGASWFEAIFGDLGRDTESDPEPTQACNAHEEGSDDIISSDH